MEKICPQSDARAGSSENASMRQNLSRVGDFFELGGDNDDDNDLCCHQIRGHFQLSFSRLFALEFGPSVPNGSGFGSIGGFLRNSLRRFGEEKQTRAKEKEERRRKEGRRFLLSSRRRRGDAGMVVEFHEEGRKHRFFHVHCMGQRILPAAAAAAAVSHQSSHPGLSHFSFVVRLHFVDLRSGRTGGVDSRLFQISGV